MKPKEIAERIAALPHLLGIDKRELDRRSDLKEGHVTVLLRRLRDGGDLESTTITKLAKGGSTTDEWLMSAIGQPPRDSALEKSCPAFFQALNDLEGKVGLDAIVKGTRMAREGGDLERGTWIKVLLDLNSAPAEAAMPSNRKPSAPLSTLPKNARSAPAKGRRKPA